jgi:hypothetical protein
MSALTLVLRAIDALADGKQDLALACLEELEALLQRGEERHVPQRHVPGVHDLSVFDGEAA